MFVEFPTPINDAIFIIFGIQKSVCNFISGFILCLLLPYMKRNFRWLCNEYVD